MFSYERTVPHSVEHAERIVVIPDIHRDIEKAKACLILAGVLDQSGTTWTGGRTVVVQIGDQIDGADRRTLGAERPHVCHRALKEDVAVISMFNRLHTLATRHGGAVYSLFGNHEIMNVKGQLQYADTYGCPVCTQARLDAFRPGGAVARVMATTRSVYLRIGRVAFVHAGVLPWHFQAASPEYINNLMTEVLLGIPKPAHDLAMLDRVCLQEDGMLTTRAFTPDRHISEGETRQILRLLGVDHIVIGHNAHPQGVTALHGGMVFVCDPGMSASVLDGAPKVLEITPPPPQPHPHPHPFSPKAEYVFRLIEPRRRT